MQPIKDFLTLWRSSAAPYIICGENVLTYHEINTLAEGCSHLLSRQHADGQNVAVFAGNSPEYITAYFANVLAGNTNIPINVKLTDHEVISELEYCDCNWVITQTRYVERMLAIADVLEIGVVAIGEDQHCRLVRGADRSARRANSSDIAVMLHTSGTTGRPKKVMLSHQNLRANTESNIKSLRLTDDDRVLIVLPLFFGYCHTAQFLTHTRLGGTIVLYDRPLFTAKDFLALVQRHRVTCTTAVPTMLGMINSCSYLDNYDLRTLRYMCFGGGPSSSGMLRELMAKLPHTGFVHTYGQTECSPRVTALLPEDSLTKIGSVGTAIPNVQVEIVDEDDTVVAVGAIGEIRVRGENICQGYYRNAEESGRILRNGWLYTGDLARRDEDGCIYLVGRKKNVVITGGINVYPEEIEEVIRHHEGIEDAVVYGEADPLLGEVPAVKVVVTPGAQVTLEKVHGLLKGKLAPYKWPRKLYVVDVLEKTATGKTRRDGGSEPIDMWKRKGA